MANRAATRALGQRRPVICRSSRNSSTAVIACRATFIQWCPPACQPEQLAIEHVRIGRQRMVGIGMPVVGIVDQAPPREAAIEMLVVVDVVIVVIVDEIVACRLAKNEDNARHSRVQTSTSEFTPSVRTTEFIPSVRTTEFIPFPHVALMVRHKSRPMKTMRPSNRRGIGPGRPAQFPPFSDYRRCILGNA